MEPEETKHLQCTEVWGGNQCVDRGVAMPGLDAYVFSQPCGGDDHGGDVHYVSSCAAGQIARLLVADVAGHGQKVSQTAGRLRQLMRRHVSDHSQVRLIRSVNRAFAAIATEGIFATAVVLTFDSKKGKLLVSSAGHPPPLLYRASRRAWMYLEPSSAELREGPDAPANLPLGIEESDYDQLEVRLRTGDIVLCYTDWLPEARNAAGELLGKQRLLEIAQTLDVSDPAKLVPNLMAAVERWAGAPLAHDDLTVLLFRPNGLRSRLSVGDYLLAPVRLVRAVAGSYLPSSAHP